MDIDRLRWILAGCGVMLVAGIYIRELFRGKPPAKRERTDRSDSGLFADPFSLKAGGDESDAELDLPSLRHEPFDLLMPDAAALQSGSVLEAGNVTDQGSRESDYPSGIVQIKMTARDGMCFPGDLLIDSLRAVGLEYGSMNIFHKPAGGGRPPVFSVVNMIEPGTFPVDDPSHFESPGIVFFLQAALSDQPVNDFDEMVRTAHMLAARIGGEIRDAKGHLLTVERTLAIRDSLVPVAG